MLQVRELKDQALTPQMVLDVHAVVTEGTLDDPADAGRIQRPGEERIRIYGDETDDHVLHVPPPAEQLPERMRRLCDFANGAGDFADQYVPPLVRSVIVHFMMGYDHYFVDGNGRTARALFQWSMLRQGFFLAEFLSISRLLCQAPDRYARSFLRVEQDEGDLTHFLLAQARVISRAITDLYAYLARKSSELGRAAALLRRTPLNNRQIAVIESFLRDPSGSVSAVDHQEHPPRVGSDRPQRPARPRGGGVPRPYQAGPTHRVVPCPRHGGTGARRALIPGPLPGGWAGPLTARLAHGAP